MVPRPARRNHIKRRVHTRKSTPVRLPKPLLALATLVVGLAACLGIGALGLFVALPKVLSSDDAVAQRVIVTAVDPTVAKNHVLMVVKTSSDKSAFYWLDGSKKITVPGGYGEYELRAAVALLALEKKDEHQFKTGLSHALSTIVTAVVPVSAWSPDLSEDIENQPLAEQTKELSNYFYRQALHTLPRDLPRSRQLFSLHTFFKNYVSLQDTVPLLQPSALAGAMHNHPLLAAADTQSCPVAIINTTEVAGLASHVSELAEQSGAVVIRIEHEDREQATSQFLASPADLEACGQLIQLLGGIFPQPAEVTHADDAVLREYRAKLVLLLGDDLGGYYAP